MPKIKPVDVVAAEVIVCTKCSLSKTRKKAVPGAGNPESRILFIGEAPGKSEDAKGEPFVGAAGRFLDTLLIGSGLSREEVFITNIVKCRPPGNRQPKPSEIETCASYLDRQIRIVRPRFIITLGNFSTAYIFSKAALSFDNITEAHGKSLRATFLGLKVTVFPTFHPAAALYNGNYKKLLIRDFQLLGEELGRKRHANHPS